MGSTPPLPDLGRDGRFRTYKRKAKRMSKTLPATSIEDIIPDRKLIADMVENGYIRIRRHPEGEYQIWNYSEKAQYDKMWNAATINCRGLITDGAGKVIARSFPKFWNYGQAEAGDLDLSAPVEVTDKIDGSLGILYPHPDGRWAIATRGSFTSEQALHATEVLRARYPDFEPPRGWTVLVEIVYPANRIVLDYAGLDDLVLLGAVDNTTGASVGPDEVPDWPGRKTDIYGYPTLAAALAAAPRPHAEGYVVRYLETGQRVKIKQADYVRLHSLVTGTSTTTVWESLASGHPLTETLDAVPDEFMWWVQETAAEMTATHRKLLDDARAAYRDVCLVTWHLGLVPDEVTREDRKRFATVAATHPLRSAIFALLDQRDITEWAWKQTKPAYARPFCGQSEDSA